MNGRPPLTTRGIRFLAFGGINTAVTYALFLLLVQTLHMQLAYGIAFMAGIAIAYIGNGLWVFAARLKARSALAYPLLYGSQYSINAGLLQWLGTGLGWTPWLALITALCVSMPISFLMNQWLFGLTRVESQMDVEHEC